MSRRKTLETNTDWCKGCGICVAFCPREVLDLDENGRVRITRPDDCTYCADCEVRCPDFAIAVKVEAAS